MANPMETEFFGLLAGPPWHLRGPGPGCPALGSRLPPRGIPPRPRRRCLGRGLAQPVVYEAPLSGFFVAVV
eukprot:14085883-Alexandrium_andersonii.AAC.1